MRQLIAFVKKEFHHVFRDKRTMLILLGMPVVQIILFGFAISTEIRNINVVIDAPNMTGDIRKIAEALDVSEYFTVTDIRHGERDTDRFFIDGTANMVVVFPADFSEEMYSADGTDIQLIVDASNTNTARASVMYATGIIRDCMAGEHQANIGIIPNMKMLFNPQMKSSYGFVPGVMGLIIILICAMMTSISIVREKETGTMELLLVSPMKPLVIIIAKMIPYLVLSVVNYLTILLMSVTVLDVPIAGSFWTLSLLAFIYIIVSLALGLMISTRTATQVAAMLGSGMILMMPVMFFSGLLFPIESMPKIFQVISNIVPARWFISGVKKIMIEGLPVAYIAKELIILSGMALFLIVVSLKNFKYRLK